jgi:hypothetical protein
MSDGMVGRPNAEIAAAVDTRLNELLVENGGEHLVDEDAAYRTVRRVAQRIVSGEIRPGIGAMTIGGLSYRWEGLWGYIRPFYGAWEQIHPDLEPPEELIELIEGRVVEDARRLLESDA